MEKIIFGRDTDEKSHSSHKFLMAVNSTGISHLKTPSYILTNTVIIEFCSSPSHLPLQVANLSLLTSLNFMTKHFERPRLFSTGQAVNLECHLFVQKFFLKKNPMACQVISA